MTWPFTTGLPLDSFTVAVKVRAFPWVAGLALDVTVVVVGVPVLGVSVMHHPPAMFSEGQPFTYT